MWRLSPTDFSDPPCCTAIGAFAWLATHNEGVITTATPGCHSPGSSQCLRHIISDGRDNRLNNRAYVYKSAYCFCHLFLQEFAVCILASPVHKYIGKKGPWEDEICAVGGFSGVITNALFLWLQETKKWLIDLTFRRTLLQELFFWCASGEMTAGKKKKKQSS